MLSPHEISIPDGIFKQGTDKLLKQIPVQAIGPETSGIVVVTPQDAEPYLRLSKPISTQGLGLLLLDHSHPACAGSGSLIRFPCKCELTNEPILVSARLIQIGSIEVTKYVPSTAGTVDEVSTNVFRVALYKDEIGDDWGHIIQHPIKHILTVLGIDNKGTNPSVVDVWDRQFLTINMTRTKAAQCEIFFASIRLVGANCNELQARSGFSGLYVEPRSIDGRNPSEQYRVIWLKLDKASTTAAMQSSNLQVHLARHGVRYGLRASSDIAEEVHRFHKATVPYLDTVNVLKFLVGPFPFGATRDGITKVFEQWGWCARPTQPKGRAPDGIGIQWEVHASNQPPCDVYSMTHGDVIIAALPTKKPTSKVGNDLLASAKTIAYLRQPKISNAATADDRDPIQINDPWASYVPSKAARTPSAPSVDPTVVRVGQIESLAASVDRKLADHMAQVDHKLSNADVNMGPPPGMDQQTTNEGFEHRLQALEKSMHQQQAHQVQHQNQVAQQFQQMQAKIDTQTQSFHSHLDQRMTEQLSQIEALLSKKARKEWRCPSVGKGCPHRKSCQAKPFAILSWPRTILVYLVLLLSFRFGEAANPGPIIGTVNPTGLLGKAATINQLPTGVYSICESHLSAIGLHQFRRELAIHGSQMRYFSSSNAPLIRSSVGVIGGRSTGVGFLSSHPGRNIPTTWDDTILYSRFSF